MYARAEQLYDQECRRSRRYLYAKQDVLEQIDNSVISVDGNTLYTCFVSTLPAAEGALETRDLYLKHVNGRRGVLNLKAASTRHFSSRKTRQSGHARWKRRERHGNNGGKLHGVQGRS